MKAFVKEWELQYPGLDVLLLTDQLGSHLHLPAVQYGLKHGVHSRFFPGKTTHFLQPLDGIPFANFSQRLQRALRTSILNSIFRQDHEKGLLMAAALLAEADAFTRPSICASFRDRGIFPFDAPMICQLAEENARQPPTPVSKDVAEFRQVAISVVKHAAGKKGRHVRVPIKRDACYADYQLIDKQEQKAQLVLAEKREQEWKRKHRQDLKVARELAAEERRLRALEAKRLRSESKQRLQEQKVIYDCF